jgi:hypothetical protein
MIQTLRVFDDALTNEEQMEMMGEAQYLIENPDHSVVAQGETWPGMLATKWAPPLVSSRNITAAGFRLYLPENLEKQPTFIHHDQSLGNNTCITLVQGTEQTGVAFFRHKGLGWDRIPSDKPAWWTDQIALKIQSEGQPGNWAAAFELTSLVELLPRRHIIFDSSLFHARWPLAVTAPRLVHVCWFD